MHYEDVKVFNEIKAQGNPRDLEMFSNLMRRAHARGQSAVSLVRENPSIICNPSSIHNKLIRKLCEV